MSEQAAVDPKEFLANLKVETAAEQERRKAEGSNVLPRKWRSASRRRRSLSAMC